MRFSRQDASLHAIIHGIAHHSDAEWTALLSLRGVCWAFRMTCDVLLVGHLVLTADPASSEHIRVRSRLGQVPPRLARLRPSEAWVARPGPWRSLLLGTFAVTVVGFIPPEAKLHELRHVFTTLSILRLCPDMKRGLAYIPYVPFPAMTVSFFALCPDDDPARTSMLYEEPTFRPGFYDTMWTAGKRLCELLPPGLPPFSPKVIRIVVNSFNACTPLDLGTMYHVPTPLPSHVREVVVVLPFYIDLDKSTMHDWNALEAAANIAALISACDAPHVHYTILGVEEVKYHNFRNTFRRMLTTALMDEEQLARTRARARGKNGAGTAADTPAGPSSQSASQLVRSAKTGQSYHRGVFERYAEVRKVMNRVELCTMKEYADCCGGSHRATALYEVSQYLHVFPHAVDEADGGDDHASYMYSYPDFKVALPEAEHAPHAFFEMVAEKGFF